MSNRTEINLLPTNRFALDTGIPDCLFFGIDIPGCFLTVYRDIRYDGIPVYRYDLYTAGNLNFDLTTWFGHCSFIMFTFLIIIQNRSS